MTQIPPSPLPDESLLLSILMGGPATLTDAQLVATLLNSPDLARANALLHAVGNLYHLVHAAPVELSSFGLAEDEIVRLLAHTEVTSRVVAQRHQGHLGSLNETVRGMRRPAGHGPPPWGPGGPPDVSGHAQSLPHGGQRNPAHRRACGRLLNRGLPLVAAARGRGVARGS